MRVSFLFGSQEEPGSQQDPEGARMPILLYFWLFSFGFRWSDGAGFVYLNKTESLTWQFLICFRAKLSKGMGPSVKLSLFKGILRLPWLN